MEFETPREAALRAENAILKAENNYLRRALDFSQNLKVTPVAVIEEMLLPTLPPVLSLPLLGSVHGGLSRYGNYHVLAKMKTAPAEDLTVNYYAPAVEIKGKADYFVNQLFPYLHQRFIQALAGAINPLNKDADAAAK